MSQLSNTRKLSAIGISLLVMLVTSACNAPSSTSPSLDPYFHQSLETGDVGMNVYSAPAAGQSSVLPREYPGAPPLIPHSIVGHDINKDGNGCLDCHTDGVSLGEGHVATKIPDSHYTDLSTNIQTPDLQELRYNCTICHLQQSDEEPLWCLRCHNEASGDAHAPL